MLWWLSHSERLHPVKIRLGFFFPFRFFLVRTQPAVFCEKKESVRFITFFAFVFFSPLRPALTDSNIEPPPEDLPQRASFDAAALDGLARQSPLTDSSIEPSPQRLPQRASFGATAPGGLAASFDRAPGGRRGAGRVLRPAK